MFWCFGGKGWLSKLISNGGVCRTDPATPGLLIRVNSASKLIQSLGQKKNITFNFEIAPNCVSTSEFMFNGDFWSEIHQMANLRQKHNIYIS